MNPCVEEGNYVQGVILALFVTIRSTILRAVPWPCAFFSWAPLLQRRGAHRQEVAPILAERVLPLGPPRRLRGCLVECVLPGERSTLV